MDLARPCQVIGMGSGSCWCSLSITWCSPARKPRVFLMGFVVQGTGPSLKGSGRFFWLLLRCRNGNLLFFLILQGMMLWSSFPWIAGPCLTGLAGAALQGWGTCSLSHLYFVGFVHHLVTPHWFLISLRNGWVQGPSKVLNRSPWPPMQPSPAAWVKKEKEGLICDK